MTEKYVETTNSSPSNPPTSLLTTPTAKSEPLREEAGESRNGAGRAFLIGFVVASLILIFAFLICLCPDVLYIDKKDIKWFAGGAFVSNIIYITLIFAVVVVWNDITF